MFGDKAAPQLAPSLPTGELDGMTLRYMDVENNFRWGAIDRLYLRAEDLEDEAAEMTLAGNPRRAWWLEQFAERLRYEAQLIDAEIFTVPLRKLGMVS